MLARNGEGRNAGVMKAACATEGLVCTATVRCRETGRVPEGASTVASEPREARR
jgi:hypothetical protein